MPFLRREPFLFVVTALATLGMGWIRPIRSFETKRYLRLGGSRRIPLPKRQLQSFVRPKISSFAIVQNDQASWIFDDDEEESLSFEEQEFQSVVGMVSDRSNPKIFLNFLSSWIRSEGGSFSTKLGFEYSQESKGWHLVATSLIEKDEVVIEVPPKVQITSHGVRRPYTGGLGASGEGMEGKDDPNSRPPEFVSKLIWDEVNQECMEGGFATAAIPMALALLRERRRGDDSPIRAYIRALPKSIPSHPLLMNPWELELLESPTLEFVVEEQSSRLRDFYQRHLNSSSSSSRKTSRLKEDLFGESAEISMDEFGAVAAVMVEFRVSSKITIMGGGGGGGVGCYGGHGARQGSVRPPSSSIPSTTSTEAAATEDAVKGYRIVPIIDLAQVVSHNPNADMFIEARGQAVGLMATEPIQPGSPITITKGEASNDYLMLNIGRAFEENPFDRILAQYCPDDFARDEFDPVGEWEWGGGKGGGATDIELDKRVGEWRSRLLRKLVPGFESSKILQLGGRDNEMQKLVKACRILSIDDESTAVLFDLEGKGRSRLERKQGLGPQIEVDALEKALAIVETELKRHSTTVEEDEESLLSSTRHLTPAAKEAVRYRLERKRKLIARRQLIEIDLRRAKNVLSAASS
eukprot:jgi/Bigna1/86441/estExt_fgenesh1_pg.C_100250